MSGEQGSDDREVAREGAGDGAAPGAGGRKRSTSTPLMEAAAKAAEEAAADGSQANSQEPEGDAASKTDDTTEAKGEPAAGDGDTDEGAKDIDRSEAATDPPPKETNGASGAAAKGDDEPKEAAESKDAGPGIRTRYFGTTEVGLVREHNEDNFMVADLSSEMRDLPEGGSRTAPVGERGIVLAVCDGMGGAAAGEVASQMAVDTIYEVMQAADPPADRDAFARRLVHAIEEAGSRIFSSAKMDRSRRGMGTTATAAALVDEVLFVGQVGDSRAYVLRNGELGLISKDQSLVNQLIEAGQLSEEEAEAFEHSNIILQALGTTEEVNVDLTFLELRRGDRVMLCSDGLSGLVHGEVIRDILQESQDHQEACKRLVEMANAGGGHDNVTLIIADFDGEGLAAAEGAPKPSYQQYPLPPGEVEGRGSLPPRDTRMKHGGPKPGADVKHGQGWGRSREGAEGSQGGSLVLWLVAAVVALLFVGAVVALSGPADPVEEGDVRDDSPRAAAVESQDPVDVTIHSDVTEAEVFVDGKRYGTITEDAPLRVGLPPGAYRVEARSDGSVVASASLTVLEGEPTDLDLMMPSGLGESDGTGGAAAEPAPEPAPSAAPQGPSGVPAPAAARPAPRGDLTQKPPASPTPAPEAPPAPKPEAKDPAPAPPPAKPEDAPPSGSGTQGGGTLPDNPF
jgi:PPM family protein phosphatase